MRKITKRKTLILISIGIIVTAVSQILSRFIDLSDSAQGLFTGFGVGLLLTAIIFGKYKTVR
ncbi:hypothetical protein [Salinimicrobium sp. GXAS 041]|uniref:hypothetical protein n=1 Tax=Salinimicrobium sp. GXAS 041 TaxID=3400806 RepID=UPI003C77FF80